LKTPKQLSLPAARAALLSAAALLLPFLAAADSHVATGAPRTALVATAHLDFKIIIPRVLSLNMLSGVDRVPGATSVAIFTNSHNVTLAATLRASDEARGNVILNAAARKTIAQNASCTLGSATSRVTCTASMP
jgi:hypothetical protein